MTPTPDGTRNLLSETSENRIRQESDAHWILHEVKATGNVVNSRFFAE